MSEPQHVDLSQNRLVCFFDPETLDELPLDLDAEGRFAWTGRESEVDVDLQYNRARCFDATVGRASSPTTDRSSSPATSRSSSA